MKLPQNARFALLGLTAIILVAASVVTLRDNGGGASNEPLGHLGPTPGPSSEGYIRAKRTYLEGIASTEPLATSAALVSYRTYVPAPSVQRMVREMEATFVWVRFPSAEAQPIEVETTVAGAVADAAANLRRNMDGEIEHLEDQAATAQGAGKADLDAVIAGQQAALAKVTADCGCVFAVSVEEAQLGALRSLLNQPSVRHVDVPDPVTNDLSGWELQPFVPVSP